VHLGTPRPNPVLSGGGHFSVDPTAPVGTPLDGAISQRRFAGGPGAVPLRLGLVPRQPPVEVHLAGAHIEASCDADGCREGKVAGGIVAAEVDAVVIPALAAVMQVVIDETCSRLAPTCEYPGQALVALFDANGNRKVTADELRENELIRAIFAPDLDLFAADGSPGQDGVNDSLSVALGFTSNSATFALP
jgi:hypothetical protein